MSAPAAPASRTDAAWTKSTSLFASVPPVSPAHSPRMGAGSPSAVLQVAYAQACVPQEPLALSPRVPGRSPQGWPGD